ncbi:MAG: c-type cytochrome [Nevskiales bacterium]|nr:c-type cytochrome [Nevskiales bacterium]
MDPHHHDKLFIVTFLGVIGFLAAFTVGIIVIANLLDTPPPGAEARVALEERLKPAGQVITDPAALLAASGPAVAQRAPLSGAEVVTRVCIACHGSGVLDAPRIGDKARWSQLKAEGLDRLVFEAIEGERNMPPRGGDPSLSDAEIRAAVKHMLKLTGL